jgi:hypothetical protein
LIKAAEEREADRKKERSTKGAAQQKQALIQFREHITAVLSQEVRDALQLTYEWNQAQRRPHAVFHLEHPTQGSIACDIMELDQPGV